MPLVVGDRHMPTSHALTKTTAWGRCLCVNVCPRGGHLRLQGSLPCPLYLRAPICTPTNKRWQVTDRAGDAWSNFEGTEAALYQVQIEHQARPSVTFGATQSRSTQHTTV